MLKAVFFDLDGTLLPFNEDEFLKSYFKLISGKMINYGFEPKALIDNIWNGTKLMYKNDGTKTNEEVFWDYLANVYGKEVLDKKSEFDKFYTNEFKQLKSCCGDNNSAKEIVDYVNENKLLCVLSTNPIFPKVGTLTRMSFVGLREQDFEFVTAYENYNFSKPNPMYFKGLLEKFNLKPEEVILFGNNELEDAWCANQVGIKTYLVGDFIITSDKLETKVPVLKMEEVVTTIKQEIELRR